MMCLSKRTFRMVAFMLSLSSWGLAGCDSEEINYFIEHNMGEHQCVDYDDEGTVVVLKNHCKNLLPDENAYNECSLTTGGIGVAQFNMSNNQFPPPVTQALERYRWITVNPSYTDLYAATMVASAQLKVKRADGVLLVYLPHGPDKDRVIADGGFADSAALALEANRYVCGDWVSEHPYFLSVLHQLILSVVRDPYSYEESDATVLRPVMVTSFSYSGPQTLRALYGLESTLEGNAIQPKDVVYFWNVAPTFGMTKWQGDHGGVDLGGDDECGPYDMIFETDGVPPTFDWWSDGPPQYREELRETKTPQCMIASLRDCISAGGAGTYLTLPTGHGYVSDCLDPITMPAMGQEVDYDPAGRSTTVCFDYFPYSAEIDPAGCRAYADVLDTGSALYDNYTSGARSIIVRPFYTTDSEHDLSKDKAMTTFYGEFNPGGHFGYWFSGNFPDESSLTPEWDAMNPNFNDELVACAAESAGADPDCGACDAAEDWANNVESPTFQVYWNSLYKGIPVERNHFVYAVGPGETCCANETFRYGDLVNRFLFDWLAWPFDHPADGQVHVTDDPGPSLIIDVNPPDPDGDAEVTQLYIKAERYHESGETIATDYVYNDLLNPSPETRFVYEWPASMAYWDLYDDVSGVWMDITIGATFRDPLTGAPYSRDERIGPVLVMKECWCSTEAKLTVPDIRGWRVPGRISTQSEPVLTFRVYNYIGEEVPGAHYNIVESVTVEETSTDRTLLDWSVGDNGADFPIMQWNELKYTWNVRTSWCRRFPNDPLCDGDGSCMPGTRDCPASADFSFKVTATNINGDPFHRYYEIPVTRSNGFSTVSVWTPCGAGLGPWLMLSLAGLLLMPKHIRPAPTR